MNHSKLFFLSAILLFLSINTEIWAQSCTNDTIVPVVICQDITISLDSLGQRPIYPQDIDNGSFDNCGISSYKINGLDSLVCVCNDLGTSYALLTVIDLAGNSATCVANITVIDTLAPSIICQPNITAYLDQAGIVSINSAAVLNSISSDNCGIANISSNNATSTFYFSCANLGFNNITVMASDASGNTASCSSIATVIDTIRPIAICRNYTAVLDASGNVTIQSFDIDNGSIDNCGIASMTINGMSSLHLNCANIGGNTVTLAVTDLSGNMDTCTSTITVIDMVPPVISCQNIANITIPNNGTLVIHPADLLVVSSDACGIANLLINGQDSVILTSNNLGYNSMYITNFDPSGNTSSCLATIQVIDTNTTFSPISKIKVDNNIHVFPNPSNGDINITADIIINQIEIYNITQQKVYNHFVQKSNTALNLKHLSEGIYLLKIKTAEGIETRKIVLQ